MPNEKIQPRSAKRFPYTCNGQISFGNELGDARLTNLSASGIQFETKIQLSLEAQVKLLWTDETLGMISSTMYIVRELHKPNAEFRYLYGARFYKLERETKDKLLQILRRLRNEEASQTIEKVQQATPEYLLEIATQPSPFMKDFISGAKKPPSIISQMIAEWVDYEKKSFQLENEVNRIIQNYSISTFQCKILENLAPLLVDHRELKSNYYKIITSVLNLTQQMDQNVSEPHTLVEKMDLNDSDKKNAIKNVAESKKRNRYAKQDMLRKVRKHLAADSEDLDFVEAFEVVVTEYTKMMDTIKQNTLASVLTKQRTLTSNPYISQKDRLNQTTAIEYILDQDPPPSYIKKTVILLLLAIALAGIIIIIKYW